MTLYKRHFVFIFLRQMKDSAFDCKRTPKQISAAFQADLKELDETLSELAKRMIDLGDHRSFQTILRSLQRMVAGDIGVSGEIRVIVKMLLCRQRRCEKKNNDLVWKTLPNGIVSALKDDFTISLIPQTKRRWLVNLVYTKNGWSPSWPAWQSSLEAAKRKALACLDDAYDQLVEFERERSSLRVSP